MIAFYVMSKGKHPFGPGSPHDMENRIMAGNQNLSAVKDQLSLDLVKSMLVSDQKKRPPAKELLK